MTTTPTPYPEIAITPTLHVLWLSSRAWKEELQIVVQHAPLPLRQWVQIIRTEQMTVQRLPDGHIQGGPCDGGQVVRVDSAEDTNYFALPVAAIPALKGLLSAAEYVAIIQQSSPPTIW